MILVSQRLFINRYHISLLEIYPLGTLHNTHTTHTYTHTICRVIALSWKGVQVQYELELVDGLSWPLTTRR